MKQKLAHVVTFLWLRPLALSTSSLSLLLLLAFFPALHLLLAHLEEQSLLLVLVQSVQNIGVDVHVL